MERRNVNNDYQQSTNTFEYSFPICDDAEDDNVDSNKSTPYYTPMEYCASSFEFPSPKPLEKPIQEDTDKTPTGTNTTNPEQMNYIRQIKQTPTATSPAVSRKLRRFSLNERRSLSPQHVLTKNVAGSVDLDAANPLLTTHDKENAVPSQFFEHEHAIPKSGNNSPSILKDESSSPKILATNFSPKLLSSINNLKLTNSPLISSAGYKNGNYFKFPEIDNVVQDQVLTQETTGVHETTASKCDNQLRNISKQSAGGSSALSQNKPRYLSSSLDAGPIAELTSIKAKTKQDAEPELHAAGLRKNRKNKNNLTIKITNTLPTAETVSPTPLSPSPSPKPKTPTIKNTKEKALSLDSAANCETGLSIVIQSGESGQAHVSCDEIDSKANFPTGAATSGQLRQRNVNSRDRLRPASAATSKQSLGSATSSPASYRSGHKPSPLLHSSNTNLKTLPEFLTLVEFSNNSPKEREQYPYKQKSMDLPSSSITTSSTAAMATTPVLRTKIAASSSGSLLQRRGSNHSLTLNLHGSCSNLVGSCRTGLSISNYSLGSVANSTTNLNTKTGCTPAGLRLAGPEVATTSTLQPTTVQLSSQGVKQSLFRRRGSNQSLSLKNSTTTSCGNLNTFTSQNSLYVDRVSCMALPGVTRTTSFITPTQNTASSAQTPKRGLLERRGSNQSLTLNMSSSFGGIGADHRQTFLADEPPATRVDATKSLLPPPCCAQHHRKFFSSENLNKPNTQFSDLNENRHVSNRPFGSASDLKVSGFTSSAASVSPSKKTAGGQNDGLSIDLDESNNVCTCSGTRNIMTRPLSPQRKAEEFKIYLANIQTLQNASNMLRQHDLIKLNYIFDNSYATNSNKSLQGVLPIVLAVDPSKEAATSSPDRLVSGCGESGSGGVSLVTTSEDTEVTTRYEDAVRAVLNTLSIDTDQQKRIFCDLHKEFWDLPLNHQEKPLVFGSQTKNRYKTILPNETTRVMLQNESLQFKDFTEAERTITIAAAGATSGVFDAVEKISSNGSGNKLLIASTETPYINANYIKGPDVTSYSYVATQGPLPNTIFEFWLMVFQNIQNQKTDSDECALLSNDCGEMQQYYQKIVMLTNFLEHHRQKCVVYFPVELNEIFIVASKQEFVPNNEHLTAFFEEYLQEPPTNAKTPACGEQAIENFEVEELSEHVRASLPQAGNVFVLKNVGIVRKNGFSIRKIIGLYCLMMKPRDGMLIKKFCCFHYWYPDWPDHRSPRDINTLLDISLHILNLGKCEAEFEAPPPTHINNNNKAHQIEFYQHDLFNILQPYPIIHCSAGVGRTGCLTAILNGVRQMRLSLAYSLSSMAADVVSSANSSNASSAAQPLSPIDFRLPTEFFDALPTDEFQNLKYTNDTDSSFTRNTLLYIRFIAQKIQDGNATGSEKALCSLARPSLTDLPRMPDIIVDILGIVCNLRLSRGGMVQNSEQYELIHRALCLYLKRTFALKRF